MENNNGTVTIPLETYQDMVELIKNQDERIEQLTNAHSVIIDRRNPTGKILSFSFKPSYTWYDQVTFQIKGSLTETNEAFKALRDELDELHARGNEREAQFESAIRERDMALKRVNESKLEQIAKKLDQGHWWDRLR
jgi:uncharacterized coiled-coil DUF342 family protein